MTDALIFDIDGTLWDTRSLVAAGYNRQLRQEGLERLCTDEAALAKLFGKTMSEIADILFGEFPPAERYALMNRCMASEDRLLAEDPCQVAYPGVQETLQALSKQYPLYIVSNSQKGYPELCIQKLGLDQDMVINFYMNN